MCRRTVGLIVAATLVVAGVEARGQVAASSSPSTPRMQGLGANPAWNPYFNPALTQNLGRDPGMAYFLASRQAGNLLGPQAAPPAAPAAPTRRGMEPAGGASKYYLKPSAKVSTTRGHYSSTRSYYPSVGR